MIGIRMLLALLGGCVFAVIPIPSHASAQVGPAAAADVRDRLSRLIGIVSLTQQQDGVHLSGTLHNLPPGSHGLHIHSVGKCLSPSFLAAGTILNPTGKQHGLLNPAGLQVGDLPNLVVPDDGQVNLDAVAHGATLTSGPSSLIGGNGTALVIHIGQDDQRTDPEGNASERLACGVILPVDPAAVSATAQSREVGAAVSVPASGGASSAAPATSHPASAVAQPPMPVQQQPGSPQSLLSLILAVVGVLLVVVGFLLRRASKTRVETDDHQGPVFYRSDSSLNE